MAPKAKPKGKVDVEKPGKIEEEKKRKATTAPEEPAAKEAKKEAPAAKETKKEEPKEEAKVEEGEKEKDAPADNRAKLKETITWKATDCTLNVLSTMQGQVLMSLSDGGMQFLIAGARANVGVKAGRYMYETKVIEALSPAEAPGNRARVPLPRQLLRIGFSTAGSEMVLGESEEGFCFDAEGIFTADKQRKNVCQRFGKNQTMAVVLNLDEKSPNAYTISLFHNGERYSEPQPIPEALRGKTLYPHVSYRNVSVQVSFGPEPMAPLPFTCRCLQTAATSDVEVVKPLVPADGKYEVMFPIAFPDEGTFDWLDTFLEKNPQYVELSDRKIIDWAAKSGLWKPKSNSWKSSTDKPEFNYGLTAMDDLSVRRMLQSVAPMVPRNYVVMEVKENLTADDRVATLKRFTHPAYKKVANVVMGEPNADYKQVVHARILQEKKEKADAEWKARKEEKERKKQAKARAKQLADMRKKAEEQRKKAEAEKKKRAEELAKKKAEEEKKKKAEEAAKKKAEEEAAKKEAGEEGEKNEEDQEQKEEKDEQEKDEDKEENDENMDDAEAKEDAEEEAKEEGKEEAKEEADAEMKEEEEVKEEEESEDEEPPKVELTEEEKKIWFRPPPVSDLTSQVLSQAFGKFTLPEKDEGFDEIRYEWQSAKTANAYLRKWVLERKVTSKMEELKPSDWFKGKHADFVKSLKEWQDKQKPFAAKKKEEEKQAVEKPEEDEEMEEDADKNDDVDIFAIEDICDVGNGEPLFVHFSFEDWALFTLRYEFFLLVQAFKHDVDDEERIGIHESNLVFYYNKYFHKQLTPKFYGKENNRELVDFVKDTVTFDPEKSVLMSSLEEGVDSLALFIKMTEEGRRERQRRVDAGDETARLKFNPAMNQVSKPTPVGQVAVPGTVKPAGPVAAVRPQGGWPTIRPAGASWRPQGGPGVRPQASYGVRPWAGAGR